MSEHSIPSPRPDQGEVIAESRNETLRSARLAIAGELDAARRGGRAEDARAWRAQLDALHAIERELQDLRMDRERLEQVRSQNESAGEPNGSYLICEFCHEIAAMDLYNRCVDCGTPVVLYERVSSPSDGPPR